MDLLVATPAILYRPIGAESDFKDLVDLVGNRAIIWKDENLGAKFSYEEIPADLADKAAEYREKLIELAVEQDDDAMEAYLEGNLPDVATQNQKGVNNVAETFQSGATMANATTNQDRSAEHTSNSSH